MLNQNVNTLDLIASDHGNFPNSPDTILEGANLFSLNIYLRVFADIKVVCANKLYFQNITNHIACYCLFMSFLRHFGGFPICGQPLY